MQLSSRAHETCGFHPLKGILHPVPTGVALKTIKRKKGKAIVQFQLLKLLTYFMPTELNKNRKEPPMVGPKE